MPVNCSVATVIAAARQKPPINPQNSSDPGVVLVAPTPMTITPPVRTAALANANFPERVDELCSWGMALRSATVTREERFVYANGNNR